MPQNHHETIPNPSTYDPVTNKYIGFDLINGSSPTTLEIKKTRFTLNCRQFKTTFERPLDNPCKSLYTDQGGQFWPLAISQFLNRSYMVIQVFHRRHQFNTSSTTCYIPILGS